MIEKRLVQWYAANAGVDLDIAEREVALTYVLRVMLDADGTLRDALGIEEAVLVGTVTLDPALKKKQNRPPKYSRYSTPVRQAAKSSA